MIKSLFIVAGHGLSSSGGNDNGAARPGINERDQVVEIARDLYERIAADPSFRSIEVLKIGVDERLKLTDKIARVNAIMQQRGWGASDAILLSLHVNAASNTQARGLEAWHQPNEGTYALSLSLVDAVAQWTGIPKRPRPVRPTSENRFGRLGIIDDTAAKAVLFECGFLSNEFDAAFLLDTRFDDRYAVGLHEGLRSYLGLVPSPDSGPGPGSGPNTGSFQDVPPNAWYADDVALCLEEGLFEMSQSGNFHPDRPVNRAELATVMARHLRKHHMNQP